MDKKSNTTIENCHGGFMMSVGQKMREFGRRKDGAAAVEFAFVVPIMLSLYFGTMELSQGIDVNKKAGRASSLVGDLVTQQAAVTKAEIIAITNIAAATLQPYKRSAPVVELVGIQVNNETPPKAKVTWSQRVTAGAGSSFLTVGDVIVIPSELLIPNTFMVKSKLRVDYYPFTSYQISLTTNGKKGIGMGEEYYLRPRMSPVIVCSDC
jgi:Flp pilus assembly protein TadG